MQYVNRIVKLISQFDEQVMTYYFTSYNKYCSLMINFPRSRHTRISLNDVYLVGLNVSIIIYCVVWIVTAHSWDDKERRIGKFWGSKNLESVGGRWMNEYGAMMEWYWQGKTEVPGEKHYTAWVVDGWMGMEQWWNDTDRGKLKYWEKNIIQRGW